MSYGGPATKNANRITFEDYVEIKAVEGMGYGVFARRAIRRGTRILKEGPALTIGTSGGYHREVRDFCDAYINMDARVRDTYDRLHCDESRLARERKFATVTIRSWARAHYRAHAGSATFEDQIEQTVAQILRARGVFTTNCAWAGNISTVYVRFSRLNHSCEPNCSWNTLATEPYTLTITTEADITPGEQLFLSYNASITDPKSRENFMARRAFLRDWGFECACARCLREEEQYMQRTKAAFVQSPGPKETITVEHNNAKQTSAIKSKVQPTKVEPPPQGPVQDLEDEQVDTQSSVSIPPVRPRPVTWTRPQFPLAGEVMNGLNGYQELSQGPAFPISSAANQANLDPAAAEVLRRQQQKNDVVSLDFADVMKIHNWNLSHF